jgi:hypothetical protein
LLMVVNCYYWYVVVHAWELMVLDGLFMVKGYS